MDSQKRSKAREAAAREARFLIWGLVAAFVYLAISAAIKFEVIL
ncbi:hypothetical protein ACGYK5_17205 [Sulfitobacter sp. 1A16787]